MINRKYFKRKFVLVIAGILVVSLTGCRPSPVLEQVVYQEKEETDTENETDSIDNNKENEQENEQISSKKEVDEAQSNRDQKRQDALSGDGDNAADTTYDSTYDENAQSNGTDNQMPQDGSDGGNGTGNENGGNGSQGEGVPGGEDINPSDGVSRKQIVDGRGETVDVPENVNSVTATGEAAIIVEMLGGSNRLAGTNSDFKGNALAQSAFASQGISNAQTWWNGSGAGAASDFDALLAAKPDVCFEISGQGTFSSDQIAALKEADISYVVLPKLTSFDNIKSAVNIVGQVLGDKSAEGGTNAPQIAQQHAAWSDNVVEIAKKATAVKSTIYISAWDTSAFWEIKNAEDGVWRSGYGVPIGQTKSGTSALGACMSAAKLTNTASENTYVVPLRNNYWLNYCSGGSGIFQYGRLYTQDASGNGLGSDAFPAVVVADSTIKSNMENDFRWQSYGRTTDAAGNSGVGFDDGNGHIIGSTIVGNYDIYVNPTGLGSWTEGSVEAPLEALWLSCKIQGSCSMDELRSTISDFYNTFYHISVDTASILGE